MTDREKLNTKPYAIYGVKGMTDKDRLYDALENVIWYNHHYEWLKDLRNKLEKCSDTTFSMPDGIEWHTEYHCMWMLLVGMFGDWGSSIRGGWIDDFAGCIRFIDEICKESWEADANREL